MSDEKGGRAPAIARAAAILRLLGRSPAPLGVQAIARELGLVPSTCLYVLRALVVEQLVAVDPVSKLYTLDAGVLTLARGWLRRDRFTDLAQATLDQLAQDHGVTTLGVQISGLDHIIVVAKAEGGGNIQLSASVGSRFPALISATGRCLVAFGRHAPEEIARGFVKLRWANPPTLEVWLEEIAQTRLRGYAVDAGHYIAGVTVLAAPVRTGEAPPSHALVALGLSGTLSDDRIDAIGMQLLAAAGALGDRLAA